MNDIEDIFLQMVKLYIDEVRNGKLPKAKFLGKYMAKINEVDKINAFRFKRPQCVGDGKEADNNWLDYILKLNEEEFNYFKEAITNKN